MSWIYEIDVGKHFTGSPVSGRLPTLKRKRKMPIYMMLKKY